MINTTETQDSRRERGLVAVDGNGCDGQHPVWCSPGHCFVTEGGVRVHEQAPVRWEDHEAEVLFESRHVWAADADDRQAAATRTAVWRDLARAAGVPDPGVQDDDGEVAGYFVGECGHPAPLVGPVWRVGPCGDCDAGRPRA